MIYICDENFKPQIKLKGSKFSCFVEGTDLKKIEKIVDETKNIKDFVCADVLEKFYEDDKYIYYWSCTKNSYMIVVYQNGSEETISDALKYNNIQISDLDNFNIKYIKLAK